MGVDTIYFKWRKDHFVCLGSGDLMTEFCSIIEYANYYRTCKDMTTLILKNSKQTPLCIRSFFHIISEFLQIYRENLNWFRSSEYFETESVLELSHFMAQSFVILECIYKDILFHFAPKIMDNTLRTHDLISHLFQLLLDILCDEYTVKSSTIMSLFLAAISPYFDILDEWMFNGRLIDPFGEFFVKTCRNLGDQQLPNQQTNIWQKYVLCPEKIPCFLNKVGVPESILINGKSLQILRNLQRATNKEFDVSSKPYSSTFEHFKSILSKYYPLEYCIQVIAPKKTEKAPSNRLILSPTRNRSEIVFASPANDNRKPRIHSLSKAHTGKQKLDPIQMMTWINCTDQMFSDPPKQTQAAPVIKMNDDELFGCTDSNRTKTAFYRNDYEEDESKFIYKEMAFMPLQHVITGQLLPIINAYCFKVNQLLLDSIDLFPHLVELKLFYFIEASDILYSFLPSLIDTVLMMFILFSFPQIKTTRIITQSWRQLDGVNSSESPKHYRMPLKTVCIWINYHLVALMSNGQRLSTKTTKINRI